MKMNIIKLKNKLKTIDVLNNKYVYTYNIN